MSFRELTITVLAKRFISSFESSDLVKWSIEILKLGVESTSLDILAGLDHENTLVREKYFFKILDHFDFKIDSKDLLLKEYAFYISKKFLHKILNQDTSLSTMYTIHSELDSKSDLEIFYKICIDLEILEDTGYSLYTNLTLDNKDEFIYKR
ncbi:hypothetical protein [Empedobacter brevis]|uniref:hypothetical protein n=1 Tax=Empedobacter brevis TaxID=247 RepID=UPI002FE3F6EA